MPDSIRDYFEEVIRSDQAPEKSVLQTASAALLIEIMQVDGYSDAVESEKIVHALKEQFQLSDQNAAHLMEQARKDPARMPDYDHLIKIIDKGFSYDQKLQMLEHLWEVAYADNKIEMYEEFMIQKISERLGISRHDYYTAKKQAENESRQRLK